MGPKKSTFVRKHFGRWAVIGKTTSRGRSIIVVQSGSLAPIKNVCSGLSVETKIIGERKLLGGFVRPFVHSAIMVIRFVLVNFLVKECSQFQCFCWATKKKMTRS